MKPQPAPRPGTFAPLSGSRLDRAWEEGRLEQRCPACGLQEAAGLACSRCATPTGVADWREPRRPKRRA